MRNGVKRILIKDKLLNLLISLKEDDERVINSSDNPRERDVRTGSLITLNLVIDHIKKGYFDKRERYGTLAFEDVFNTTFKWTDLDGKDVKIIVSESDDGTIVIAKDIEDDKCYVLHLEVNEETQ